MTKVALTGAGGFLGWHTRAALLERESTMASIAVGARFDLGTASEALSGSSRVIHIAGVNRAPDDEVRDGNIAFAEQLASALRAADAPPPVVVFANSTQSGNETVYGAAKAAASSVLASAASDIGAEFVDLQLPNLFGEHGRPFYNAVTATFSHLLATGQVPRVDNDRELTLLHAQDAADLLTGAVRPASLSTLSAVETVSGLLARIRAISETYAAGEIPDIATAFSRNLFNTYRSYTIEATTPIGLTRHADSRGSFFEIIRSHGGSGQSSFSTTVPGIVRGDHFHRRKVERFTVLAGRARISLRRLFSNELLSFDVIGDEPVAIDMPTMWAHNIVNTGDETLFTSFWTNDIFDPTNPDTIAEAV